jgi:cytochrome c
MRSPVSTTINFILKENKMKISVMLVLLCGLSANVMAQDVAAGKAKYATCVACHGAQGQGGMGPKLSSQPASAIEKKLTAYKNKQQVGPQSALMWGIAAGLTPADIKNLSAYTSTLK